MTSAVLPAEPPAVEVGEKSALLSVRRIANLLDVSESHIWRQVDMKRMPKPVKIGNAVRWIRTDIDEWISTGCKPLRIRKGAI